MSPNSAKLSVLLVDDDPDLAKIYGKELSRIEPFTVITECNACKAREIANRTLFDFVVIDAKIRYRGHEIGGIRLADDLADRYGTHSIIIISQYVTADLLRGHGSDHAFFDKHHTGGPKRFIGDLAKELKKLRRQQYAFVAIPFQKELNDITKCVRQALAMLGLKCIRADDKKHSRSAQTEMLNLISEAKLMVFVADESNPNVYFEAGYAYARGKEVCLIVDDIKTLGFDVRDRLAIVHKGSLAILAEELDQYLRDIRMP